MFITGQMSFLSPNQQHQSTKNTAILSVLLLYTISGKKRVHSFLCITLNKRRHCFVIFGMNLPADSV